MTITPKVLPYVVIELDLTSARSDVAQGSLTIRGVEVPLWMANTLTIITLDGGDLDFKLNDSDNSAIPASDNLKSDSPPFTEIYWTNTAQPALTAKISIGWIDQL